MDYSQKSFEDGFQTILIPQCPQYRDPDLGGPEAQLYASGRNGYFFILTRDADGAFSQHGYRATEFLEEVSKSVKDRDVWCSQAEFWSSFRRVCNVKSLSMLFVDFDFHHLHGGNNWATSASQDQLVGGIKEICNLTDLPYPSLIVFSGRGVHCKWLFDKPVPRKALPRWNALETFFVNSLEMYGADASVKDSARVLRVPGSINLKNHQECKVIGVLRDSFGAIVRYDFEFLCECLPFTREEVRIYKEGKKKEPRKLAAPAVTPKTFDLQKLNWLILEDLRKVVQLRGGEIAEGKRELFVFWMMNFLCLSGQVEPDTFFDEASFIAAEVNSSFRFQKSSLTTLFNKYQSWRAGEKVLIGSKEYVPLYTPRMTTLIKCLEITEEEQQELTVIRNKVLLREKKSIKKRERRRASGIQSRTDYEARAKARADMAVALKNQGLTISQIAAKMNLSAGTIRAYLRKGENV